MQPGVPRRGDGLGFGAARDVPSIHGAASYTARRVPLLTDCAAAGEDLREVIGGASAARSFVLTRASCGNSVATTTLATSNTKPANPRRKRSCGARFASM